MSKSKGHLSLTYLSVAFGIGDHTLFLEVLFSLHDPTAILIFS